LNKTKIVVVMVLLSLLVLSAFSAINTNTFVQADDSGNERLISGSGQIARAYWQFSDGGFMYAFFAEQLKIDDETITNGVYIQINHSGGLDESWNSKELTETELIQMDADKISISTSMEFKRGGSPGLHTINLVWDLTDPSLDPAVITITNHRYGGGGTYRTKDVAMCIVNPVNTATVSAAVTKDKGNTNTLKIDITEPYFAFFANTIKTASLSKIFTINNNAAGTYKVGDYDVYVDTKGNDQIRACYIVTK